MRARAEAGVTPRHPVRRRLAYAPGRGYSRFVWLSKRLLPALAVGLLLLIATWPRLQSMVTTIHLPQPKLDLSEARDLRMVAAHYSGTDRQNRPFTVTAEVARQTPKVDDLVSLDGPKADMTTTSGGWIELTSYTGVYQPQPQLLDLFGNVVLYQDKGNEFHSDSAHIDMAAGTADGEEPINGHGPFGSVEAQGFHILDRGDTIVFTGHATMVILPHEKAAP